MSTTTLGNLSQNMWTEIIGPDYIEIALRAAHAADPHAKLCVVLFVRSEHYELV